MRIQELVLQTHRLTDQKDFYCLTLGLPLLAETADSFTVQAGTTHLRFQQTESDVLYHLAFTIPRNAFAQAKSWLQERVPLLRNQHGEDEIFSEYLDARSSEHFDTRSLYFCDAAHDILELIVHYSLSHETEGPFGPAAILHVSEVGLPVEDVLQLAATVKDQLALEPYPASSPISQEFAYLGDIFGQLVVVKTGRPWLPMQAVPAAVAPVRLTISGHRERQVELWPYPYTIIMKMP